MRGLEQNREKAGLNKAALWQGLKQQTYCGAYAT